MDLTYHDLFCMNKVMIAVKTSELKARLAHYLRLARAGSTVVVSDRDTPIARLVPLSSEVPQAPLVVRPRAPSAPVLGTLRVRGVRVSGVDSSSMLREDRSRR